MSSAFLDIMPLIKLFFTVSFFMLFIFLQLAFLYNLWVPGDSPLHLFNSPLYLFFTFSLFIFLPFPLFLTRFLSSRLSFPLFCLNALIFSPPFMLLYWMIYFYSMNLKSPIILLFLIINILSSLKLWAPDFFTEPSIYVDVPRIFKT